VRRAASSSSRNRSHQNYSDLCKPSVLRQSPPIPHSLSNAKFVTGVLMKNMLHGVSVLVATATLAHAADLAPAAARPEPVNYNYNWTGCYVGVSLGGDFANATNNLTLFGMPAAGATTFGGGSGGGQGGCNFQTPNNFVYGFEVDGQAAFPVQFGTAITALGAVTNSLPVFGTVRGRIGYAPVGGVLLYVTGGGGIGLEAVALSQGTLANPITQVSTQTAGCGPSAAASRAPSTATGPPRSNISTPPPERRRPISTSWASHRP
jgi:opacity protein-like surface antigen